MNDLAPDPPQPSPVGDDVLCLGCGYLLRGLSTNGACPECGLPVARSLSPDRLSDLDDDWLVRVRRGFMLVFTGMCMLVVLPITAALIQDIAAAARRSLITLAIAVAASVMFVGVFVAASPHARLDEYERIRRMRSRLRLLVCLVPVPFFGLITLIVGLGWPVSREIWVLAAAVILLLFAATRAYFAWTGFLFERGSTDLQIGSSVAPQPELVPFVFLLLPGTLFLGDAFGIVVIMAGLVGYTIAAHVTIRAARLMAGSRVSKEPR